MIVTPICTQASYKPATWRHSSILVHADLEITMTDNKILNLIATQFKLNYPYNNGGMLEIE